MLHGYQDLASASPWQSLARVIRFVAYRSGHGRGTASADVSELPLRVHRGSAVSALYGQGQSAIGGTLVMPVVSGPGRG